MPGEDFQLSLLVLQMGNSQDLNLGRPAVRPHRARAPLIVILDVNAHSVPADEDFAGISFSKPGGKIKLVDVEVEMRHDKPGSASLLRHQRYLANREVRNAGPGFFKGTLGYHNIGAAEKVRHILAISCISGVANRAAPFVNPGRQTDLRMRRPGD